LIFVFGRNESKVGGMMVHGLERANSTGGLRQREQEIFKKFLLERNCAPNLAF
jgi:hypothetical protein